MPGPSRTPPRIEPDLRRTPIEATRRSLPRSAALATAAIVLLAAGCGDGGDETGGAVTEGADGTEVVCEEVAPSQPRQIDIPPPNAKRPSASAVVMDTNCGSFTISLDAKRAPKTAASFQYLAERGVYDGTPFHRVVADFVIQGGDPLGTGLGDPGYKVTEKPPGDLLYERGVVAMAKNQAEPPGTSGSQFFIVVAPGAAALQPDFALVGEVTEGMDVVEAIAALADPTGESEAPVSPVLIENATVEK